MPKLVSTTTTNRGCSHQGRPEAGGAAGGGGERRERARGSRLGTRQALGLLHLQPSTPPVGVQKSEWLWRMVAQLHLAEQPPHARSRRKAQLPAYRAPDGTPEYVV